MTDKPSPYMLCLLLMTLLSDAVASPQDTEIVSARVGECSLTVESNERWNTLRLRAHHPNHKACHIDRDSMVSLLSAAFSKTEPPRMEGAYSSLSIGRLIDYPWLSQYLATTAYRDRGWDSKKGKPVAMDINGYVSRLLSGKEVMVQIETALAESGHRVVGVTVEKVLVGGFGEIPSYQGEMHPGRVPYDAQVWFRLEKK